MLVAPPTARADLAANEACAAAVAAEIAAAWARDKTIAAAENGVARMYPGESEPAFDAWRALERAAEANANAARQAVIDANKASGELCSEARRQIQVNGDEIRNLPNKQGGTVGQRFCEPFRVDVKAGIGSGWPSWAEDWEGVSQFQQPITVFAEDCASIGDQVAETPIVLTPPPPDDAPIPASPTTGAPVAGVTPPGMFWSGSSVVGFLPCPPGGNAFGCPPTSQASLKTTPNVCNPPTPQVAHVDSGVRVAHVDPEPQVSHVEPAPRVAHVNAEPAEPKPPIRHVKPKTLTHHVQRQPRHRGGGSGNGDGGTAVAIGIIGELLSHAGGGSGGHHHHGGGNPCGGG